METFIKIITILGNVALVVGLFWLFFGMYKFFQSKKHNDSKGMDEGIEGMIWGAVIGPVARGVVEGIIQVLNTITW